MSPNTGEAAHLRNGRLFHEPKSDRDSAACSLAEMAETAEISKRYINHKDRFLAVGGIRAETGGDYFPPVSAKLRTPSAICTH